MFHIREEGEKIRNGFNFYPLSDEYNFGVIFRYNNHVYRVRYSKKNRIWFFN